MELAMKKDLVETKASGLVVPSGWYELDREEMSYVDGGGVLYSWMSSAPIDIALMACGATMVFGGIKLFGKTMAKKFARSMAPWLAKLLGSLTGGAVNIAVGQLGKLLTDAFWNFTSLGGLVAFVFDVAIDESYNGVIARW